MEVLYRPGRIHIAPDALSRLEAHSNPVSKKDLNNSGLDNIPVAFLTLVLSPVYARGGEAFALLLPTI